MQLESLAIASENWKEEQNFEGISELKIFMLRLWTSYLMSLDFFFSLLIDSWYSQALEFYDSTNLAILSLNGLAFSLCADSFFCVFCTKGFLYLPSFKQIKPLHS